MRTQITKRTVFKAQPKDRPYEIRDTLVRGLILRVQPSGYKAWIVTWAHGKRKTLGAVERLTLEQARAHASHALSEAVQQGLPSLAKPKLISITLDTFLTEHYEPWARIELRRGARYVQRIRTQFAGLLKRPLVEIDVPTIDRWWRERLTSDGVTKTLPSTTSCDTIAGRDSGRKVTRSYDSRNRVSSLTFPDGRGDQSWSYEKDGAVSYIVTNNASGGEQVINRYAYNKRRMLTSESIEQPGWYTWSSGYAYEGNGALARQTFPPTGLSVDYAPNALGQATRAGTYATNVSYYPNGAIKQFTYGNGIVHTMTQNARQLPSRTSDLGGPNTPLDYEYSYDHNGNVLYIGDLALGSSYSRWMSYDGLDRLTAVGSAMFGGDHWHRFTYDTLDNLKTWKLAGVKDHNYYYDPQQNRLTNVNNSAGAGIIGLSYDVQGNLSNRNGQAYYFDFGNRLRSVANKDVYRYDGHGRRVLAWGAMPGSILSQYTQSGQLTFQQNQRKNTNIDHIYLAGSLVATREYNYGTGAWATRYQHTDALGSPVAITNEAAQVVERTQWEPFGAAINKAIEGVGYTGHVMDAQTGLTYMQQRYYDPQIGRFLSVDPVKAGSSRGGNFNRYWYADNRPYNLVDPDGRRSACGSINAGSCDELSVARSGSVDAAITRMNQIVANRSFKGASGERAAVNWFANVGLTLQGRFGREIGANLASVSGTHRLSDFAPGDSDSNVEIPRYSGLGVQKAMLHTHPRDDTFSGMNVYRDVRTGKFNNLDSDGNDMTMAIYVKTSGYVVRASGRIDFFDYESFLRDDGGSDGKARVMDHVTEYK